MIASLLLLLPLGAGALGGPKAAPNPVFSLSTPRVAAIQPQENSETEERAVLAETSVGMRARISGLPLPGSQLQAKRVEDPGKADAVMRIVGSSGQGNSFVYDIELTPFVPGVHDLLDYLERADGSAMGEMPSVRVNVMAVLPAGRMQPSDLATDRPERVGGYKNLMIMAGILWVLGLFLIFYIGARRKQRIAKESSDSELSLDERMRPMLEAARKGEMTESERVGLERLIFAYWRERKGLQGNKVSDAMSTLRDDDEAGPLLQQLERWLHRPDSGDDPVDVNALLEPYAEVTSSTGGGV